MREWDLRAGRQMLPAVHLSQPGRTALNDVSDPGLLGAGEHGGAYRSRSQRGGPEPPVCLDRGDEGGALQRQRPEPLVSAFFLQTARKS